MGLSVLPDILKPGLTVVFCGSAASSISAKQGAYYANPQNRFWRALFEARFTPNQIDASDFNSVVRYGIGLTDLAKNESGRDDQLSIHAYEAGSLAAKIKKYTPRYLAFTGKKPAEAFLKIPVAYGLQQKCIGLTRIWVLPSPSPAARRYWDNEPWQNLSHEAGFLMDQAAE
jgi:double-stranded uracil-DNA glycosylase